MQPGQRRGPPLARWKQREDARCTIRTHVQMVGVSGPGGLGHGTGALQSAMALIPAVLALELQAQAVGAWYSSPCRTLTTSTQHHQTVPCGLSKTPTALQQAAHQSLNLPCSLSHCRDSARHRRQCQVPWRPKHRLRLRPPAHHPRMVRGCGRGFMVFHVDPRAAMSYCKYSCPMECHCRHARMRLCPAC